MKTALIDVGGGLRGIYAAGAMDWFLENGITFDLGIGISSGSANVASYIAGQKGRNYHFYAEYSQREEYMSRKNIRTKGCFLDVQYVYGTLSNTDGENPFDYDAFCANPTEYIAVATELTTGNAHYLTKSDMRLNYYNVLMASSAMPYACAPQEVDGTWYLDGEVSAPVPLEKVEELGIEKTVLILSRPVSERRSIEEDLHTASRIEDKYPKVAEALVSRAVKYNAGVEMAEELAKAGKVFILAPDDMCGVETFTTDVAALDRLYQKGYADAHKVLEFL